MFREPTLDPNPPRPALMPEVDDEPAAAEPARAAQAPGGVPADYAGIMAYFERTVIERKSPYSALLKAADRLQEYIPNEANRLKAAYALCGDQWSPDVLSFAIGSHIADIDQARERARAERSGATGHQALELRQRVERLRQESAGLRDEMAELNASLARLQETLHANEEQIDALNQQIQLAENEANAIGLVDHAAENIKNDLLARKVILGLP